MNKICTSVDQSRKLIQLGIDIDTADMYYMYRHWEIDEDTVGAQSDAHIGFDSDFYYGTDNGKTYHYIPAWSLNSLLNIIKNRKDCNKVELFSNYSSKWTLTTTYYDLVWEEKEIIAEDSVNAAFEMIYWLLKNKKL